MVLPPRQAPGHGGSLRPRAILPALALVLAACAPGASAPPTATPSASQRTLADASAGLCAALHAMPDAAAAARIFTDEAHEALHALAADPHLDRALAARILESMERLESDLEAPGVSATSAALSADLSTLHDATDRALEAIGLPVPACAA